tara:strand:- start:642 stop:1658 length:1017 start_codon:yes stop_codon:yes gene_type:complete
MAFCLINKSNYFHNLSLVEQKIDKDKIAVVLKNNAYGHGLLEIGQLASEYGIKYAIVNTINEANLIYNFFESVLVLQDIPRSGVKDNIIITINSIDNIEDIKSGSKVEIKVDTGMNRNGIMIKDLDITLDAILNRNLILNGVFTHFANAYIDDNSIYEQKQIFDGLKTKILKDKRFLKQKIRFHCCASSSLFRLNSNEYDLARVGILSYGYVSLPSSFEKPILKPVMSLWGEKITSKFVKKGDAIGYGAKYIAPHDLLSSTYDIGYGDGFMRLDGSQKSTIEDGREILGVVSMNSFSTEGCEPKVCVFNNAERFSESHGTIVYEIISNINPNFKRIVE